MSEPREGECGPLKDIHAEGAQWLGDVPNDFKKLVALMISEEPNDRPTASELLKISFLRKFM